MRNCNKFGGTGQLDIPMALMGDKMEV